MKTELIFFDSINNSMEGTKRGLIAFISLIVFDFIWFSISKNTVYKNVTKKPNIYAAIVVYLIMCSAIAVQLPKSYKEALVYSLLVGFVIYGIFNLTSYSIFNNWSFKTGLIDTIMGMLNCGIAGSLIYLIIWK